MNAKTLVTLVPKLQLGNRTQLRHVENRHRFPSWSLGTRKAAFFVLLVISVLPCTSAGLADEAADGSVEALRKEVAELKKMVAELTEQVTALQQQIGRLRRAVRAQRPHGDLLFPIEVERAMMLDVLMPPEGFFPQIERLPNNDWAPFIEKKDLNLPIPQIEPVPEKDTHPPGEPR